MQDSSINPYIPEENKSTHAAVETVHSPLKRIVKLLFIITGVLAVLIGIGLLIVIPRTAVEDDAARVDLAKALQPPGQLSRQVPVQSTLGFSLKYDNQLFSSYAETVAPVDEDGKQGLSAYYENDDLRLPRDYNLVRITPAESSESDRAAVADPPQLIISSTITTDELEANESKPDYKGLSQLSLFVQLSTDKRLAARTADDGTTVSIEATKPSSQTIGDTKYQKVRYTTVNENNRIANVKYDDCYYTIQNETPISACITNVRPNSRDDATLDELTLQSLTFQRPNNDANVTSSDENSGDVSSDDAAAKTNTKDTGAVSGSEKKTEVSTDENSETSEDAKLALETVKPEYMTNFKSLAAIAKNQPSTVRVASLYCADLNLKTVSGEVITTLTDACVGNLSSGTIVSSDGYIATSGHSVRYEPKDAINGYINLADSQSNLLERLDRVLNYLLKTGIILDSDAEYLKLGAQTGDQEALAKIENISSRIPDNYVTPINDSYTYAIQPTNKPIAVDSSTGTRPVFAYSDSVIAAKYVASDYDSGEVKQEKFDSATPKKDIALLKASGSFQNALIDSSVSLKANDVVDVLAYPAYGDTSLVIGKHQNAPGVTSSKVDQVYDKDGQQLAQLSSPTVPGSDGGGAYDQNGKLVGVSVYRYGYCPDQQCFASGTVRSIGELATLVDEKNLTLGKDSEAGVAWRAGVDEYFKGNYSAAQSQFAKAGQLNGFNVFAEPLQKLAASKKGSQSDTSLMNQLQGGMIIALIAMVILTIAFAVVFFVQKNRFDAMYVGHYGMPTATPNPTQVSTPALNVPTIPDQSATTQSIYAPNQTPPQYEQQPSTQTTQWSQQPAQPQQFEQQPDQAPFSNTLHASPAQTGYAQQYGPQPTDQQFEQQTVPNQWQQQPQPEAQQNPYTQPGQEQAATSQQTWSPDANQPRPTVEQNQSSPEQGTDDPFYRR